MGCRHRPQVQHWRLSFVSVSVPLAAQAHGGKLVLKNAEPGLHACVTLPAAIKNGAVCTRIYWASVLNEHPKQLEKMVLEPVSSPVSTS